MPLPLRRRRQKPHSAFRPEFHHKQLALAKSNATRITAHAGRRAGKSEVAVRGWLVKQTARLVAAGQTDRISWIVLPTFPLCRPIWRKIRKALPEDWITNAWGSDLRPERLDILGCGWEFKSAEDPESLVAEGLGNLWVDECGLIKERAWLESLRPTTWDYGAPTLLTGKPYGKNWFYKEVLKGRAKQANCENFSWSTYDNPYIDRTSIDADADEMTDRQKRQEIYGEFLEGEGSVFKNVRLCSYQTAGTYSIDDTVCLGIDLGKHKDYTVLHGYDARGWTTFWKRWRKLSWPQTEDRILANWQEIGKPMTVIDATGAGDPPFDHLKEKGLYNLHGYVFTNRSKMQAIESLALAVEKVDVGFPDEPILLNELETYEYEVTAHGNTRYNAPEGLHDDAVIAAALGWWGVVHRGRMTFDTAAGVGYQPS